MKITMYELLGLVKDDKAPNKVKYKDKIYFYNKGYDFDYLYNSSTNSPLDKEKSLFTFNSYKDKDGRQCWDDNSTIDFLNSEVEIIEEEKKIEKIYKLKGISASPQYCYTDTKNYHAKEIREMIRKRLYDHELYMRDLKTKINEIIDYFESKGE